jgi:hypothetical protein
MEMVQRTMASPDCAGGLDSVVRVYRGVVHSLCDCEHLAAPSQ